ncbi:MAG: archease [Phycisphaerales bacterium]|nr:MAG: archease [Phycisphaerales bacterium]
MTDAQKTMIYARAITTIIASPTSRGGGPPSLALRRSAGRCVLRFVADNTGMEPSYELFDHTADVGIRAFAPSLAGLVKPAGDGLYDVIGEVVPGAKVERIAFDLRGGDPATLLRDYLHELLILFERSERCAKSVDVSIFDEQRLAVTVEAAVIDDEQSAFHREVKAITYHELGIREIPGGYEATIIVDI